MSSKQIPLSPPLAKWGTKTAVVSSRPMPACLTRKGIVSVSDNLAPGDVLNVGRAFMNVFRPELEARLIRPVKKSCPDKDSSPSRSGK